MVLRQMVELSPVITGNTFTANQYPIKVYARTIDANISGNIYVDNMLPDSTSQDFIFVYGSDNNGTRDYLKDNRTYDWLPDGAPYRITDEVWIQANNNNGYFPVLQIYPGTHVVLDHNRYFRTGGDNGNYRGALKADSVRFSSYDPAFPSQGIRFHNHTVDSESYLDGCIIENATDGVYAESSHPVLTNNTFRNNVDGVEADGGAMPEITNNTFEGNTRPISVYAAMIDSTIYGNTYVDNIKDYIEVQGDEFGNDTYIWARDGGPYVLNGTVYVRLNYDNSGHTSLLRISDGTEVRSDGHYLNVGHNNDGDRYGSLQATNVTFTSLDEDGTWPGIVFHNHSRDGTHSLASYLDGCIIENATDGVYAASSHPVLTNSTFRNNVDGIEADGGAYPVITGNTFTANQYPIKVYARTIDGNISGNIYVDNMLPDSTSQDFIFVYGSDNNGTRDYLKDNRTYDWLPDGAPYRITDEVWIQANNNNGYFPVLQIYPGTHVVLDHNRYFRTGGDNGNYRGALKADSVRFSSYDPAFPSQGIRFHNHTVDSESYLDGCIIENATDGVYAESSHPVLTNNTFRNNVDGVEADGGAMPEITNNTFEGNTRPISVYAAMIDSTIYGNTYVDNIKDYIEVQGDEFGNDTYIWARDGGPYVLNGIVNIQLNYDNSGHTSLLRISDGTEVRSDGHYLNVGHNNDPDRYGSLQATNVTFTSLDEDGTWPGIVFHNHSRDGTHSLASYLDGCIIENATDGVYAASSHPVLTNGTFRNNVDGVEADGGAMPEITNNTFEGNTRPISVYAAMIDSTIYGNTYVDNIKDYIEVQGDEFGNDTYIWARDGGPYVLNGIVNIQLNYDNAGHTSLLRISDGTEVRSDGHYLNVGHNNDPDRYGSLQATNVTFTSLDEDGTWPGIVFRNYSRDGTHSLASYLDGCIIENATDGVYAASSHPVLTNGTFRNNVDGVEADGGAMPEITNNTFEGNTRPISVYAAMIDSTIYGNTYVDNIKDYIEVQGDEFGNDTYIWARDGGPYVLNGTVYVRLNYDNSGHTSLLRISDGTEVRSDGHYLNVGHNNDGDRYGSLQATNVTFTSLDEDGTWPGIVFHNHSRDGTHSLASYLDGCIIENATDGVYAASSHPVLTNSTFRNNVDGVHADAAAHPIIEKNTFSQNETGVRKITNQNTFVLGGALDKGNLFIQNEFAGLVEENGNSTIDATYNYWGSLNGPEHSNNPEGDGDVIFGLVDFTPFISLPTPNFL